MLATVEKALFQWSRSNQVLPLAGASSKRLLTYHTRPPNFRYRVRCTGDLTTGTIAGEGQHTPTRLTPVQATYLSSSCLDTCLPSPIPRRSSHEKDIPALLSFLFFYSRLFCLHITLPQAITTPLVHIKNRPPCRKSSSSSPSLTPTSTSSAPATCPTSTGPTRSTPSPRPTTT